MDSIFFKFIEFNQLRTHLFEELKEHPLMLLQDLSPLAAFVAAQHADVEEVDLDRLVAAARQLATAHLDFQSLKAGLLEVKDKALRRALRFCLLVASQDGPNSAERFLGSSQLFAARLRRLRAAAASAASAASVVRGDNRDLLLAEPVDAVITSPPYPGVYNYMAAAASAASALGFRAEQASAEIGCRVGWRKESFQDFAAAWQLEQEQWLQAAFKNLAPGGTATLMIGDGDRDSPGDGAFDCLSSTVDAAKSCGFELLATASIRATGKSEQRMRGMRRTDYSTEQKKEVAFLAPLGQEVEAELRELSQECRKKYPLIKEYTDRAILKIRHHREDASNGRAGAEFPLEEVLRAILMACETFHGKIVLISLSCLQRLILRGVLKDETVAIVVNLMKEQATNGDETVQLKVLQTVMATPSHIKLLDETVVEQLMQLLYGLHNSANASVHHTACAGLRQLAEHLADKAALAAEQVTPASCADLENIRRTPSQWFDFRCFAAHCHAAMAPFATSACKKPRAQRFPGRRAAPAGLGATPQGVPVALAGSALQKLPDKLPLGLEGELRARLCVALATREDERIARERAHATAVEPTRAVRQAPLPLRPGEWSPRWRVLRGRDAFPGQDLGRVPVTALAQAKAFCEKKGLAGAVLFGGMVYLRAQTTEALVAAAQPQEGADLLLRSGSPDAPPPHVQAPQNVAKKMRVAVLATQDEFNETCLFDMGMVSNTGNGRRYAAQALLRELLTADGVELAAVLVYDSKNETGRWALPLEGPQRLSLSTRHGPPVTAWRGSMGQLLGACCGELFVDLAISIQARRTCLELMLRSIQATKYV
ncbi:unnamed protein product, partial [Effrenium voratum]